MASSYTLGDHFDDFVEKLVSSGRYASANDVMRDSLRLLEEREQVRESKLAALRSDIHEGLESGPTEPLDMVSIKQRARERRRLNRTSHGA